MTLETYAFDTPLGWINVTFDEHYIYRAVFSDTPALSQAPCAQYQLLRKELDCYFANQNHRFQLSLKPEGSIYQQRVWNALMVIPAGRTLSYGELAAKLQSSPRAVGQACKKNPIALFIPCHRVVAKTGLGGYMGREDALHFKQALLAHEQV
ncbi:methylated-DNA--[protein]-cysteine S-methyltransferase [Legionella sp. CNM-4043-24]|uniref:methylated-DNA--[protein]-cysteine S-methyltransferase n=1 Tax=Legionella sp. CNM-4043-24 TaxID=3421646 RepID=UPI00403AB760